MKLILTGGGDSQYFEAIDAHFISLLGSDPSLLFIPLAGDESEWNNGLERIKETFSTISFDRIEMCLDLSQLDWEYLKNFSAIYIDGGNTFDLMDKIHHTHTYELLHRFIHHGGVINGDSAGAIVLGSHLETAHFGETPDVNETDVISYQGLNFLGKWAIHCHYEENENDEILEFVKTYGFPVIALHENSAVFISDREIHVIGENKINLFTFNNIQIIQPSESTLLNHVF